MKKRLEKVNRVTCGYSLQSQCYFDTLRFSADKTTW